VSSAGGRENRNAQHAKSPPVRPLALAEWIDGQPSQPVSALIPDEYDDHHARLRGFASADYYGAGLMPTDGPTVGFLWTFRHQLPVQCIGVMGRVDISIVYQLERGGCWHHLPGRPDWLCADDAPAWARGALYTASNPIHVGDETRLYFTGTIDRHGHCGHGIDYAQWVKTLKELRGFARIGLAKWTRDRIMGYRSYLSNRIILTPGTRRVEGLTLNAVTEPNGCLRAALTYENGEPIPGYGFDQCQPIAGDHLAAPLRWNNISRWPTVPENRSLHVRIELTNATLFAFDFAYAR